MMFFRGGGSVKPERKPGGRSSGAYKEHKCDRSSLECSATHGSVRGYIRTGGGSAQGDGMVTLALPDELFLHAHDESGKMLTHRSSIEIGLLGAALIQMWIAERVDLVDGLVVVRDPRPVGHPLCDRTMEAILSLSNAHAPRTWVGWLNEGALDRVRDRLIDVGVLARGTSRRLGLGKARYRIDEHAVVTSHARTRYAVLGLERPAPETAALCGLIAVLRLEGGLYVNLSAADVLNRLEMIGRNTSREVREMIAAVDAASASASVSMYR